jgi:outer membrane protein assembly complex protein YaeT
VDLSFDAEVGTLAHFGPVEIVGNRSVSERVIRRQLTYQPGDLYRRSLVQDVQQRLYGLQVFQFVHVEPLVTESQSPDVPTRITVAEGKHQRMNFGFGYGSEEKARADAEYRHLNFFGSARSAGIRGRWSSLDRGVRLDFTQPYFFGPHLSLSAEGQHWYSFTPAYESLVTGAKIGVTHRASQRTSWTVSVLSERDVSTIAESALNDPTLRDDLIALGLDPDTGEQAGTLSAVSFDYQRTTADNLLNPRRGYQLAFHYEDAGNLLPGTFQYFGLSTDARHYLPIGKSFVVGSRLALGNLRPPGDDATLVPFSKKYFLGGSTTIRGWGRYEVSPLSESGLPLGGNSMMAFSEEFRALTGGKIEVAAYLDGGNVWADSWGHKLDDLRYSVGSGLRYQTPIGPIRFDYGYQLNPIPNLQVDGHPQTRRWRIHFSIGQAF